MISTKIFKSRRSQPVTSTCISIISERPRSPRNIPSRKPVAGWFLKRIPPRCLKELLLHRPDQCSYTQFNIRYPQDILNPCFTPVCFTPSRFNAPCQFTSLPNLRSLIFVLTPALYYDNPLFLMGISFLIYALNTTFSKTQIGRKTRAGRAETNTYKLHGEDEHREVLNDTCKILL
jgi:hypothetical protein